MFMSSFVSAAMFTGLYLPTSDVDAVIMGSGCTDVPQVRAAALDHSVSKCGPSCSESAGLDWARTAMPASGAGPGLVAPLKTTPAPQAVPPTQEAPRSLACPSSQGLKALANALARRNMAKNMQVCAMCG